MVFLCVAPPLFTFIRVIIGILAVTAIIVVLFEVHLIHNNAQDPGINAGELLKRSLGILPGGFRCLDDHNDPVEYPSQYRSIRYRKNRRGSKIKKSKCAFRASTRTCMAREARISDGLGGIAPAGINLSGLSWV